MKPKPRPRDTFELFQSHFDQLLDPSHDLLLLADKVDWASLEAAFIDTYCPDNGAPAKAIRLMVGLHYLKYAFNESDESYRSPIQSARLHEPCARAQGRGFPAIPDHP